MIQGMKFMVQMENFTVQVMKNFLVKGIIRWKTSFVIDELHCLDEKPHGSRDELHGSDKNFMVQGMNSMVQMINFMVQGMKYMVQMKNFMVQGMNYMVQMKTFMV